MRSNGMDDNWLASRRKWEKPPGRPSGADRIKYSTRFCKKMKKKKKKLGRSRVRIIRNKRPARVISDKLRIMFLRRPVNFYRETYIIPEILLSTIVRREKT